MERIFKLQRYKKNIRWILLEHIFIIFFNKKNRIKKIDRYFHSKKKEVKFFLTDDISRLIIPKFDITEQEIKQISFLVILNYKILV